MGVLLIASLKSFGMSYMPPPEFYSKLEDSVSFQYLDSLGRTNPPRNKRIYRYQLDSSILDAEYRFSKIQLIYGAEKEERIVRFYGDSVITKNGVYQFRNISGLTNFYGPRFSRNEKIFLFLEPLVLAAVFTGFELIRYSQTNEFRWQMPVFPLGIAFGIVLPFTLDFDSQWMVVK
jgi:hypothetical protein